MHRSNSNAAFLGNGQHDMQFPAQGDASATLYIGVRKSPFEITAQ